jgi:hypothetical protein
MKPEEIFAALGAFRTALARVEASETPWAALQTLVQRIVGARLFTVMAVDLDAKLASRLYTNMPDAYPVSGTKPIAFTPWFEQVVLGKKMFVMNTIEDISQHFFDHELIASLGCGSSVNLPVVVHGRVLGTVNMLNPAGYFTPGKIALVDHLRLPAMAAFLAANCPRLIEGSDSTPSQSAS